MFAMIIIVISISVLFMLFASIVMLAPQGSRVSRRGGRESAVRRTRVRGGKMRPVYFFAKS